ncbi:MAG: hypothetical protein FWF03_05465 [Defluviitaleaceae bacterium]|nr:hypothetical protein [Defluviitaleaceae bacterium]
MRKPFDFGFLKKYGDIFKLFENQSSGALSFGAVKAGKRYFLKFAGAEAVRADERLNAEDAISRLKATVKKHEDLRHPLLIGQLYAEDAGGGFIAVYDWFDGVSCGYWQRGDNIRFMALPVREKLRVYAGILEFHAHAASKGYVAIDFNDQSTLYDFETGDFAICDVDFYAKQSYMNGNGTICGDPALMSPEEKRIYGLVDEISNVYTMGALAFVFFAGDENSNPRFGRESWALDDETYNVALKAASAARSGRHRSISEYLTEWSEAADAYLSGLK